MHVEPLWKFLLVWPTQQHKFRVTMRTRARLNSQLEPQQEQNYLFGSLRVWGSSLGLLADFGRALGAESGQFPYIRPVVESDALVVGCTASWPCTHSPIWGPDDHAEPTTPTNRLKPKGGPRKHIRPSEIIDSRPLVRYIESSWDASRVELSRAESTSSLDLRLIRATRSRPPECGQFGAAKH